MTEMHEILAFLRKKRDEVKDDSNELLNYQDVIDFIDSQDGRITDLESNVDDLEYEVSSLEGRIAELEEEMEDSDKIDDLEAELEAAEQTIADLEEEITDLEAQIDDNNS